MVNLKVGNTSVGKISIIEPPEVPIVEATQPNNVWTRPSHWLDMPTIGSGEHKAVFLWAIPSGENTLSNYVRFVVKGLDNTTTTNTNYRHTDYTIDWGDGNTEYHNIHNTNNSLPVTSHSYNFSDLNPDTEFEYSGQRMRQALITVDCSVNGSGLGELYFKYSRGSQRQSPDLNILEYNINAPSGTIVGSNSNDNSARQPLLEKARVYAPMVQYLDSHFAYTYRLKSVELTTGTGLLRMNQLFLNSEIDYLPDFETSGVQSVRSAFQDMRNIEIFPSGKYNFENVYRHPSDYNRRAGFTNMFYNSSFKEIHIDIPEGGTDAGYQSMSSMFTYCHNLKKVTGNWNTEKVQSMYYTFRDCGNLESHPEINFTNATDTRHMYYLCRKIRTLPRVINLPRVNNADNMFQSANLNGSIYIEDIGSLSTSTNRSIHSLFAGCNAEKFEFSEKPMSTTHSYGISSMFSSCQKLKTVGYFSTSGVTNLGNAFNYCRNLKSIGGFNSESVTSFSRCFYHCESLETVPDIDITAGGTGNVHIGDMFYNCRRMSSMPISDFSRVYYGSNAFAGMTVNQSGFRGFELDFDFSNMTSDRTTNSYAGRLSLGWLKNIKSLVIPLNANLNSTFSYNVFLKTVPFVEASGAYSTAGLFNNCYNLEVGTLSGVTSSIGYYRTCLSSGAIADIFDWLGTANQTIDIRYTPGTYDLHPDTIAVATNKGWTVTT